MPRPRLKPVDPALLRPVASAITPAEAEALGVKPSKRDWAQRMLVDDLRRRMPGRVDATIVTRALLADLRRQYDRGDMDEIKFREMKLFIELGDW